MALKPSPWVLHIFFAKLRSGAMKALRWDRPGASPHIRLGLLHYDLDPFLATNLEGAQTFQTAVFPSISNPTLRAWWGIYCDQLAGADTNGPFGKVQSELNTLGLHIDADGRLWFSNNAFVQVFQVSETLLQKVLLSHFQNHVASQVPVSCWL